MAFGKQLKRVLEEIDMSVATLSRLSEIPASTIYSIIDRDTNTVGIDKVKRIEKSLRAVPGSVIYNLLYGIEPEQAEVSTRQQDFSALSNDQREWLLIEHYHKLNIKGQVKVIEYAEDMAKILEYINVEN